MKRKLAALLLCFCLMLPLLPAAAWAEAATPAALTTDAPAPEAPDAPAPEDPEEAPEDPEAEPGPEEDPAAPAFALSSLSPAMAPAAAGQPDIVDSGSCGDNLTWTLDSAGLLTVSGQGAMTDNPWDKDKIKTVVIENGVTTIGGHAFNGCEGLTAVTIPIGVTTIGEYAFFACTGLTEITIPEGVTTIGGGAFEGCTGLTAINVAPGNPAYISVDGLLLTADEKTLVTCPGGLKSVIIPDSVTTIGEFAFCGCEGLTAVTIPIGVTTIGEYAFVGCTGLTEITILDSVTTIGDSAFLDCRSLTDVTIGSGVTTIGDYAFSGCTSLTAVTIPDSVTTIGEWAFFDCTGLTDVTIGSGVTTIGERAFAYCTGLRSVTFAGPAPSIGYNAFSYVTATVGYPAGDPTWTAELRQNYGGTLTWTPYASLAITAQPKDVTAAAGAKAAFTVAASGRDVTYQWQVKTPGGAWKNSGASAAKTATLSFNATAAQNGYQYRCIVKDAGGASVTSDAATLTVSAGVTITAQPKDVTAAAGAKAAFTVAASGGGLTYQWQVRTPGGDWKNSGASAAKTATLSFNATAAQNGYQYRCVVKDAGGASVTSDAATLTVSAGNLATPKLNNPTSEANGVKLTWGKVAGAAQYRVFVKGGSYGSKWVGLGNTAGTSYVHTAAVSGTQYTYTVRCVSADGKSFTSDFDAAGKTIKYAKPSSGNLATPKLNNPTSEASGVKITWGKVTGAAQYRVFVKGGSYGAAKWVGLGNTTGTGYVHTAAVSGTQYTYTVRCVSADGKSFTSDFDAAGKTIKYTKPGASGNLATPKLNNPTSEAAGVKLTWGKVTGAAQYRVFVKGGSYGTAKWVGLGNTTGTSYVHTAAVNGVSYTYTVRCVSADGKSFTSDFDAAGKTIKYAKPSSGNLATPKLNNPTSEANGVKLTWGKVAGAAQYRVFVKGGSYGSKWVGLGNTTGTGYIHKDAKSGVSYTYTVRCVSADGKSYTSDFDAAGKTITFLAVPELLLPICGDNGVHVFWNAVPGAAKYRVFVKNGTGWKALGDTTATNYLHAAAAEGASYTYTVRCISADGKAYTSAYDAGGWTITYAMLWETGYYVDELNRPTDQQYVSNRYYFEGTFSNSAATGAPLYAQILADQDDIAIMLLEDGDTLVENASSGSRSYAIRLRLPDGSTYDAAGIMPPNGDRIFIDGDDVLPVFTALCSGEGETGFYITNAQDASNTYRFSVGSGNFLEKYAQLLL